MKIGIIGLGWYGTELAKALSQKHDVRGTKSSRKGVEEYAEFSFKAFYLNLNDSPDYEDLKPVFNVDALVINIPPSRSKGDGNSDYQNQMEKITTGIKKHKTDNKVIFISSTGVFGENQVEVDEDTVPVPTRESGKILKIAEDYFLDLPLLNSKIIRPGGLVGGDRHPGKYLAGRSQLAGKNHPVNLVHRDDLVALTQILLESDFDRKIFHAVSSDHPKREEYYCTTAERRNFAIPQFDLSDTSTGKKILGEKTQAISQLQFRSPLGDLTGF